MQERSEQELRDEQIRAATIGELSEIAGPIELVEYDPSWSERFESERERIVAALGEHARAIEHVGSTAVPGLAAKPIVDVLLIVADSSDEESYVPALEAAGFHLRVREPDWYEHRMLKSPDSAVNLHVFSEGSPEAERMVGFRDRLRRDDQDRERYAAAKRELARKTWKYLQHYADAKASIVEDILARGEDR